MRQPLDPGRFHYGRIVASDLCPGLSVQYDHNMPVRFLLFWNYRYYRKQIGSIWMAHDGRTVVRYLVPTVTKSEAYSDKLVALHKWLRGCGKPSAKKYEAMLPTHPDGHGTRTSVAILLDADGSIDGLVDHPNELDVDPLYPHTRRYRAIGTPGIVGEIKRACLNPVLRCWEWWTPGKRALDAAQALRRECSQFGRAWVRPFISGTDASWGAGVAVALPGGQATSMLIKDGDSIADIEKEKDRIASWAMNQIEIPGPMFC